MHTILHIDTFRMMILIPTRMGHLPSKANPLCVLFGCVSPTLVYMFHTQTQDICFQEQRMHHLSLLWEKILSSKASGLSRLHTREQGPYLDDWGCSSEEIEAKVDDFQNWAKKLKSYV
jgi:hypothetical protein